MTELSDKMVDRLESEFGATVNRDAGEIEFYSDFGEDFILSFDQDDAVEDIADQAENFDEDEHVLLWTVPQIDRDSLYSSLSDIEDAAEGYLDALEDALIQMKSWVAAGMTDEEIKNELDSHDLGELNIDMDNGEIVFDQPAMYRDCGTGDEMTVDDVMNAIQYEYDSHDIDNLICDEIGVEGTGHGAPPITGLIEDSQGIHKTLNEMADMLIEQRDLEQQQEACR